MDTPSSPQLHFCNKPFLLCDYIRVDILGILKLCKIFYIFLFSIPDQKDTLEDTLNRRQHSSFFMFLDMQRSNNANDLKLNKQLKTLGSTLYLLFYLLVSYLDVALGNCTLG